MKNIARFLGGLGFIFLIFGGVASLLFQGKFRIAGYFELLLGVAGVAVFLFYYVGDAFTAISRKKDAIFGIIGVGMVFLVLIGANVIARSQWGERKFDTTTNRIHSLSPDSVALVRNLTHPITIAAFFPEGARELDLLRDLVGKYTYESSQIKLSMYEPDKEPAKLQDYDAHSGEIVVRNETTKKSIKLTSLSEQDVTSAIKRVLSVQAKTVYFLQGHGEGDIEDDKTGQGLFIAKMLLQNEGFNVQALNLAAKPEIPKDASIVIAWGAQRPVTKTETDALSAYLEEGGTLVLSQDPLVAPTKDRLTPSGFEPVLEKYGLEFKPSIVLEYQIQLLKGRVINAKLAVTNYGKSPITSKLGNQSVTEFFLVQPVAQKDGYKGLATRTEILSTSENSWSETDIGSIFVSQRPTNAGKKAGPLPIGQLAEWKTSDTVKDARSPQGRLIVFGDSDFGNNQLIQTSYNRDLFLNTFNYMAGDEAALSIRPKTWTTSTLEIDQMQRTFIYYSSLLVVPQLILMLGLIIWMLRRARA